jgi:hypothetical protein
VIVIPTVPTLINEESAAQELNDGALSGQKHPPWSSPVFFGKSFQDARRIVFRIYGYRIHE